MTAHTPEEITLPPLRRVDDQLINVLVADVAVLKTQMAENTEVTKQVRDILSAFRVTMAVAKWTATISAAIAGTIAAVVVVVKTWRNGV